MIQDIAVAEVAVVVEAEEDITEEADVMENSTIDLEEEEEVVEVTVNLEVIVEETVNLEAVEEEEEAVEAIEAEINMEKIENSDRERKLTPTLTIENTLQKIMHSTKKLFNKKNLANSDTNLKCMFLKIHQMLQLLIAILNL